MGLGLLSQENLLNFIDCQGCRLRQELMVGVIILVGLFVVGMVWYRYVEDWIWLDVFYMIIIILVIVGFGEIYFFSLVFCLFIILLILMGLLIIGYMVNCFIEVFI